MADIQLLFPNRIDGDGATLSGGSWLPALPLANLQNRVLSKVARSTNDATASTRFVIDLGRERSIDGLVLMAHNLSTSATYEITASANADLSSPLYASGPRLAYPSIYQTVDLPWSHPHWWSGLPDEEDLADLPANAIHLLSTAVSARYWRVIISDESNPVGYVQIGRVFIGSAWRPPMNYVYGAKLGIVDPSTSDRALSGTLYFDERPVYRTAAFAFDGLPEDETFPALFDLIRKAKTTREIFYVPDADDLLNIQRRSFICHAREPQPIEQSAFRRMSVAFVLEELP